jgi:hypothetical protein
MLVDFTERLRGALPRVDALLLGVDDSRAHRQLDGKWSIAQNIRHLSDVGELWQERLEDRRLANLLRRLVWSLGVGSWAFSTF